MVRHTMHYILMLDQQGIIMHILFYFYFRMMLDKQTYRKLLVSSLARISTDVQDKLNSPSFPMTIWIDNYQVYQAHTAPHINQKLWTMSKMAAMAALIRQYPEEKKIDFSLLYLEDEKHSILPGY